MSYAKKILDEISKIKTDLAKAVNVIFFNQNAETTYEDVTDLFMRLKVQLNALEILVKEGEEDSQEILDEIFHSLSELFVGLQDGLYSFKHEKTKSRYISFEELYQELDTFQEDIIKALALAVCKRLVDACLMQISSFKNAHEKPNYIKSLSHVTGYVTGYVSGYLNETVNNYLFGQASHIDERGITQKLDALLQDFIANPTNAETYIAIYKNVCNALEMLPKYFERWDLQEYQQEHHFVMPLSQYTPFERMLITLHNKLLEVEQLKNNPVATQIKQLYRQHMNRLLAKAFYEYEQERQHNLKYAIKDWAYIDPNEGRDTRCHVAKLDAQEIQQAETFENYSAFINYTTQNIENISDEFSKFKKLLRIAQQVVISEIIPRLEPLPNKQNISQLIEKVNSHQAKCQNTYLNHALQYWHSLGLNH